MISKATFFSSLVLIIILSNSCTKDKLPPTYEQVGICFETEILPIFVSNCTASGCHNSIDKREGYDLTNYEGIMKGITPYKSSSSKHIEYMRRTDDERMPEPPLSPVSESSIALIEEWISKGAPNTSNCTTASCDTVENVSYASSVKPILDSYCMGCHNTNGSGFQFADYSTFGSIQANAKFGNLLKTIEHTSGSTPMPLNGGKLPDCDIKYIRVWIQEGALNN